MANIPTPTDPAVPLSAHLNILRRLLLRCLIVVTLATTAAFGLAPYLFHWLLRPAAGLHATTAGAPSVTLQTLAPGETFRMSVQIALMAGLIVVLPYLFAEAWHFLRPGLRARERRWFGIIVGSGTLLFFLGAGFAYAVVTPLVLRFFWQYSVHLGITPSWTVAHYIEFVLSNMGAFGLAFELPLVVAMLAAFGIVSAATLVRTRRYAIFLICVLSAFLTPPDAVSMALMAIPLLLLYEGSILLARCVAAKPDAAEDLPTPGQQK
ncbi:MAG: twin-arginine translocase subunit TatC [Deltaproteobacteria bacterium]|nr:twin-arginine translocase subunit TatC [Deltaproteobacteria bacterium]